MPTRLRLTLEELDASDRVVSAVVYTADNDAHTVYPRADGAEQLEPAAVATAGALRRWVGVGAPLGLLLADVLLCCQDELPMPVVVMARAMRAWGGGVPFDQCVSIELLPGLTE